MRKASLALVPWLLAVSCGDEQPATEHGAEPTTGQGAEAATGLRAEAQAFLDRYHARYLELHRAWVEADWAANTRIVEGDDASTRAAAAARRVYAEHTGSVESIGHAQRLLQHGAELDQLQVRQLERILYLASANPQTEAEMVRRLIDAEQALVQRLYGFEFRLQGAAVTPNEIDEILRSERDLERRRAACEASKEVGRALRSDLAQVRDLRNAVVRATGHPDFYAYQVADYGMTSAEMNALLARLNAELRPLYRELHTWARYELAERYGQPVPELLPAHWLPDRWAQDWSSLVREEGSGLDAALAERSAEWVVREAEQFYVSMGFEPLPASFWSRSSLYPLPADSAYKKNTHASAWHVDLEHDVRSLMSVEPNAAWYETAHHELGHVYYYLAYARAEVPPVLREGANRAFHEAIGSLLGLAAMQEPFLAGRGLLAAEHGGDPVRPMLREALGQVVFLAFGAGTMPLFEHGLYAEELPPERFNERWWELARRYQGIVPPGPRGPELADGLSKTHIHDDPGQYYDYALSTFLLFQLHDHIARAILEQDPHATNYHGQTEVGDFLRAVLEPGATRDWRALTREATGGDLSAEPMLRYFEPLMTWLRQQNRGRTHTLPAL